MSRKRRLWILSLDFLELRDYKNPRAGLLILEGWVSFLLSKTDIEVLDNYVTPTITALLLSRTPKPKKRQETGKISQSFDLSFSAISPFFFVVSLVLTILYLVSGSAGRALSASTSGVQPWRDEGRRLLRLTLVVILLPDFHCFCTAFQLSRKIWQLIDNSSYIFTTIKTAKKMWKKKGENITSNQPVILQPHAGSFPSRDSSCSLSDQMGWVTSWQMEVMQHSSMPTDSTEEDVTGPDVLVWDSLRMKALIAAPTVLLLFSCQITFEAVDLATINTSWI